MIQTSVISVTFCQEEESVSHLLFECTYTQKVWKLVNDVFQLDDIISHGDVILVLSLILSTNYVFSVIIYYTYREWHLDLSRCPLLHKSLQPCITDLQGSDTT